MRPYEDAPIGNLPDDIYYQVKQGWYERSNVDVAEETIAAMDAQHVFTACSSALKIANSMNQLARSGQPENRLCQAEYALRFHREHNP